MALSWKVQTAGFALIGVIGFFFLSEISREARPDEIEAYAQYNYWVIAALISLAGFSLLASVQSSRNGLRSIVSFAGGFFLCTIIAGTGLSGGGNLSANVTLSQVANSVNQKVTVKNDGSVVASEPAINFSGGNNVVITTTDDPTNTSVNVVASVNNLNVSSTNIAATTASNASFITSSLPLVPAGYLVVNLKIGRAHV